MPAPPSDAHVTFACAGTDLAILVLASSDQERGVLGVREAPL